MPELFPLLPSVALVHIHAGARIATEGYQAVWIHFSAQPSRDVFLLITLELKHDLALPGSLSMFASSYLHEQLPMMIATSHTSILYLRVA